MELVSAMSKAPDSEAQGYSLPMCILRMGSCRELDLLMGAVERYIEPRKKRVNI